MRINVYLFELLYFTVRHWILLRCILSLFAFIVRSSLYWVYIHHVLLTFALQVLLLHEQSSWEKSNSKSTRGYESSDRIFVVVTSSASCRLPCHDCQLLFINEVSSFHLHLRNSLNKILNKTILNWATAKLGMCLNYKLSHNNNNWVAVLKFLVTIILVRQAPWSFQVETTKCDVEVHCNKFSCYSEVKLLFSVLTARDPTYSFTRIALIITVFSVRLNFIYPVHFIQHPK